MSIEEIFQIYENIPNTLLFLGPYTILFYSIMAFAFLVRFAGFFKGVYSHSFLNILFIMLAYYLNTLGYNQDLLILFLFEIFLVVIWFSTLIKQ